MIHGPYNVKILCAVKTSLVKPVERENSSVCLSVAVITHRKTEKCASNVCSTFRMIKRRDVPNTIQIMITLLGRYCNALLGR